MIVCTPGQDAIVIEWCFTSLQEVLVEKLVLGKKNQSVTITKISFHKIQNPQNKAPAKISYHTEETRYAIFGG